MTPISMRIPLLPGASVRRNSYGLYDFHLAQSFKKKAESCPALAGVNMVVCYGCLTVYASTAPFDDDDDFDPDGESFLCPECASEIYTCIDCGNEILGSDYTYWYHDEPVCSDCYTDNYFRCSSCDETTRNGGFPGMCQPCSEYHNECVGCGEVVHGDETYYENSDDENDDPDYDHPRCGRCHDRERHDRERHDRERRNSNSRLFIEQNPPISPEQREDIFRLISTSLPKKGVHRLTGNKDDYLIQKIIDEVGPVANPIYIYGLKDRPEFSLMASHDLIPIVKSVVGYGMNIPREDGTKRLGISKAFRGTEGIVDSWIVAVIRNVCEKIPSATTIERSLPTYPDDVFLEPSNWPSERAWDTYCGWRAWEEDLTWGDMERWDAHPFEWPGSLVPSLNATLMT